MKISYLRAGAVALACALALGACGGDSGSLVLGGIAAGVTKDGLILQNNGSHDYAVGPAQIDGSSMYFFPDLIGIDEAYNVTVLQSPPNTTGCIVQNPKGRSAYNVTNVNVVCTLKTHALGGHITGLGNATGLVLVNGTDRKEIAANATSFQMEKVGEDQPYGVSVLSAPAGMTCTVQNGSGFMRTDELTDAVTVACTKP
jgi:hypothetical protein